MKVKEVESQNKLLHRELQNVKKNGTPRTAPAIDTTSNDSEVLVKVMERYKISVDEILQIKQELQKESMQKA